MLVMRCEHEHQLISPCYVCLQWMESMSSQPQRINVFFLSLFQGPVELLHECPDCHARNCVGLLSSCTDSLSSTKGHCLEHIHWVMLITKKPLWTPLFWFIPLFPVHVAPVEVYGNLCKSRTQIISEEVLK